MFGFRVLGFGAFTVADTAAFSVANSARFNDGDSDHFSFTPRTDPNEGKTFTLSFWVKRGVLGTQQTLFAAGNSASHETEFSSTQVINYNLHIERAALVVSLLLKFFVTLMPGII